MTDEEVIARPPAAVRRPLPGVRSWFAWVERHPRCCLVLLVLLAALPGLFCMPPLDRDESRFAQATTQMLESGGYVSIYFQDRPRNKKPAGIYWLQAASVWLTGTLGERQIWAYRLPSLLGAILAVLFTFELGRDLFGRQQGLLAAALLGSCVVLAVEAINAKTDAALLACIVATQLALARCWMAGWKGPRPGLGTVAVFWAAFGAGILIKGPIGPMVTLLTLLLLCLTTQRWRWLLGLRPTIGLPLALLVAAPWYVAITLQDQTFLLRAANEDLIPKLLRGVERHGQPPGSYLGVQLVALWPAALFTVPAFFAAWKARRGAPELAFLLAWLIPSWILFELIPTKLPHYTLPLYPALTLLVAWAVFAGSPWLSGRLARAFALLTAVGGSTLAAGAIWLPLALKAPSALGPGVVAALLLLLATAGAAYLAWSRRPLQALLWGMPLMVLAMAWGMGFYAPRLMPLWISPRLAKAYEALRAPAAPPLASVGYHEPSLVFLTDTQTALLSPAQGAHYMAERPKALVAVTGRAQASFLEAAGALDVTPMTKRSLSGFNYNKGRRIGITLYGRAP